MAEWAFDANIVSDLYKDAFGFRPSEGFWTDWIDSSNDEKQSIWDFLISALKASIAAEKEIEVQNVSSFEGRIKEAFLTGMFTRAEAIQAVLEALNLPDYSLMYGSESVCFELGLPLSYKTEFDPIVAKMQQN